MRIDQSKWR